MRSRPGLEMGERDGIYSPKYKTSEILERMGKRERKGGGKKDGRKQ